MKYLIIGAGGTGGGLGGFLAKHNKDVTFLVKENSPTKTALETDGLILHSHLLGNVQFHNIKVETYSTITKADVILVCVKGYSLEDTISAIAKASHPNTIVIPILNIFGTGSKLQEALPYMHILDGCIYIAAYKEAPGVICQQGNLLRVVFGERNGQNKHPSLQKIVAELNECGIEAVLSSDILSDTYQKFIMVSGMATAGAYYDAAAQVLAAPGEPNDTLKALIYEMIELGKAMCISLPENLHESIMENVSKLAPDTTSSLQKDLKKGGESEIDGIMFEVIRWGKKFNVPTPMYEKVTEKFL